MATKYVYTIGTGAATWTETYYSPGGDANPDVNIRPATVFGEIRAQLLPPPGATNSPPKITSVVISNPATKRQSAPFPLDLHARAINDDGTNNGSGLRAIKLTTFTNSKNRRRVMLLRGVPSDEASFNLDDNITSVQGNNLRKKLNDFIAALHGQRPGSVVKPPLMGIRSAVYGPAVGGVITMIETDTVSGLFKLTIPSSTLATGDKILVRGLRGPSTIGVNGPAIVIGREGSVVTINKKFCRECAPYLVRKGTVTLFLGYDVQAIEHAFFSGWGDHKVGSVATMPKTKNKQCCQR